LATWKPAVLALAVAFAGARATPGAVRPAGPLWHKTDPGLLAAARAAPGAQLPVIVRETAPASSSAEDLVRSLHGTVTQRLAIAGNGIESLGRYVGANPFTNLVSVKVAGANGATDVSVVLAGLQWIMQNRTRYDIRVLNLSFGTDSRQPYRLDPLDYAVERVWR